MVQKRYSSMRLIENLNKRKIALSKRKKGIIKKAMELSILCGADVVIMIYDQNSQKNVKYCSSS